VEFLVREGTSMKKLTQEEQEETAKRLQDRLAYHKQIIAGLTKEIEQGIEKFNDPILENCFMIYLKETENSFRHAAYMITRKAELLSVDPKSFDGQTLSRIGEADIHV